MKREPLLSERASRISPFYVMELLEKARSMEAKGIHVVHMEVGEPDFPTPQIVKDEAIRALYADRTCYTHSLGAPELRERISKYYSETLGVDVPAARIVVTNGTSGAFLLLFGAILDRGDLLALSDPGYPCYRNFGLLLQADVLAIPVSEESRFEVTPHQLRGLKTPPRLLVISNPSNPTGTIYREETLRALDEELGRNGGTLIVDEIYGGLVYGKKKTTSLAVSDDIIVVDGFSKSHAMTGWRLGWMVVPEALIRGVQRIAQNVFISAPSLAQYAALRAFDTDDELDEMRRRYQERKDLLVPELKRLGFRIPVDPEGAFYVYASIDRWHIDSMEFAERALKEAHVAITPGYDFGAYMAGSRVRFSYATSLEMIEEGCRRLEAWLTALG
jgi:aspartate/methionine/tyrosine aminotransferase